MKNIDKSQLEKEIKCIQVLCANSSFSSCLYGVYSINGGLYTYIFYKNMGRYPKIDFHFCFHEKMVDFSENVNDFIEGASSLKDTVNHIYNCVINDFN